MRPAARFAFAAGAAVLVFSAASARANGRFPEANQLVVSPTDPDLLVLRATFGVIVSKDRGASWDWICEQAMGYSGTEDPAFGITAKKSIVLGTIGGLAVSPDTGCGWSYVAGTLERQFFIDVTVRSNAPSSVIAMASTYFETSDAGLDRFRNQLFVSHDDGAQWEKLGAALDPVALTQTLESPRTMPNRLYVTATRGSGLSATGVLFVSEDEGASWSERPIPLDPVIGDRAPFIAAIDPNDPDRIYIRTSGSTVNRLFVTSDGGKSFTIPYSGGPMRGFALSPDGSRIYLGGPKDGLYMATKSELLFTRRSTVQIQCLATSGSTLYACSNEANGFLVGASEDDGATFVPKLRMNGLRGALACDPGSTTAVCAPLFPDLQRQLGTPEDAGADASDAGPPAPGPSDDGCSLTRLGASNESANGAGAASMIALVALALLRRTRGPSSD